MYVLYGNKFIKTDYIKWNFCEEVAKDRMSKLIYKLDGADNSKICFIIIYVNQNSYDHTTN